MERVVFKNKDGDIAYKDVILYASKDKSEIGKKIRDSVLTNFKVINPKYYIYKDDNCLVEIWYDYRGIVLDNGYNQHIEIGMIADIWSIQDAKEITYAEAMKILSSKGENYGNKDLMSRVEDELEQEIKNESPAKKQSNNGGATDYYALPEDANTLQDLIEYRNMNGSIKDIFKACYRLGIKTEDELRDTNKMAYYSLREVGRITGRKDYITIAKELMGSQAIEKE